MSKTTEVSSHWTRLSPQAMLQLGLEDMAYVKPVSGQDGATHFAVHTADGTRVADFASLEIAFAACRQNDLEPLSVH